MSVIGPPPSASNTGAQAAAPTSVLVSAPSAAPFANASSPSVTQNGDQGNGKAGSQIVWAVKAGSPDGELVFSPNVIEAQPGDLVQFQFYARVSQS
jgi:plastocyanin